MNVVFPHGFRIGSGRLAIRRRPVSKVTAVSVLLAVLICSSGCTDGDRADNDEFLIRVDDWSMSADDFYDALEIAKAAYPYNSLKNEATLQAIKKSLLKQITEELILARRAEDLDIHVTEVELEEAVASIRENYPGETFETTLLENAIPFHAWKERLRMRLLMEKVIERELVQKVTITSEEIAASLDRGVDDPKEHSAFINKIDSNTIKQLRRKKAQQNYPLWMEEIQQHYQVELNSEKWEEILN